MYSKYNKIEFKKIEYYRNSLLVEKGNKSENQKRKRER